MLDIQHVCEDNNIIYEEYIYTKLFMEYFTHIYIINIYITQCTYTIYPVYMPSNNILYRLIRFIYPIHTLYRYTLYCTV